jgi:hypothetical protein
MRRFPWAADPVHGAELRANAAPRAAPAVDFSFCRRYTSAINDGATGKRDAFRVSRPARTRKKFLKNLAHLTDTLLQFGAIVVQIRVYWVQRNVRVDAPE